MTVKFEAEPFNEHLGKGLCFDDDYFLGAIAKSADNELVFYPAQEHLYLTLDQMQEITAAMERRVKNGG
jgi:hypothetical protein